MDEIESQIAKIQLGNNRSSSSYVFVLAEKAESGPDTELYVVAELPLFNPAAEEACERICLAIASTFKRSYKRGNGENTFENAIAQINDELGKLAGLGQTQWIDKLNCILGIKQGNSFSVASTGKVAAFLLRGGEFTDISCSSEQSHPLKTFENYASGKIRLDDLVILSTTQLFNHISMDRLLTVLQGASFLTATQTIIALLKENADPSVSFGVLLNLQVAPGQSPEEEVDLENYILETPSSSQNILGKAWAYVKTAFALDKTGARAPKTALPKVSLGQSLKNISGGTKNLVSKSKEWWQVAKVGAGWAKDNIKKQNFKNFSPQKKFFLASIIILFLAVVINIGIAIRLKKSTAIKTQYTNQLKEAKTLADNAQSSLLYKDQAQAANFLAQAKSKLPEAKNVPDSEKDQFNEVTKEIKTLEEQMQKVTQAQVSSLGNLGPGNTLIGLPGYAATEFNKVIISYNKQSGKIEDSALKTGVNILSSVYVGGNLAVIYDGSALYVWDFGSGNLSAGFSQSVPQKDDFGGLAFYPTNRRVYVADKKTSSIISFAVSDSGLSAPKVSVTSSGLNQATALAIDSNIYVLNKDGTNKFTSGKLANFNVPTLNGSFSQNSKISTQKDFKNIYILDAGNNKILIVDKNGSLLSTLTSDKFTKLLDFQVDEAGKVIYVLNDGGLLKVSIP